MSLVIQFVIGQFEFVEADHLTHPRFTGSRRVGVDVYTRRHWGVRISRDHPLGAVVHVPAHTQRKREITSTLCFVFILLEHLLFDRQDWEVCCPKGVSSQTAQGQIAD